jgi:hypothetical protein
VGERTPGLPAEREMKKMKVTYKIKVEKRKKEKKQNGSREPRVDGLRER